MLTPPVGPAVMVGAALGGVVSTTHVSLAMAPVLPAASTWRTRMAWLPSARPVRDRGLVHVAQAAPSSEHWRVPALSASVMVIVDDVELVGVADGARPRVGASGAAVSTVHVAVAADPTLPAVSTSRTPKVTDPSASGPIPVGLVHADQAPDATWHWYASPAPAPVKAMDGVGLLLGSLGCVEMVGVAAGGVVSTTNVVVVAGP